MQYLSWKLFINKNTRMYVRVLIVRVYVYVNLQVYGTYSAILKLSLKIVLLQHTHTQWYCCLWAMHDDDDRLLQHLQHLNGRTSISVSTGSTKLSFTENGSSLLKSEKNHYVQSCEVKQSYNVPSFPNNIFNLWTILMFSFHRLEKNIHSFFATLTRNGSGKKTVLFFQKNFFI